MPKLAAQARASLVLVTTIIALLGIRLVDAAPAQQTGPFCAWERLASGDASSQHSLVALPDRGLISFGGISDAASEAVTDTLRLLDLDEDPRGRWRPLLATGDKPGPRAQHSSVLRPSGVEPASMITFGGVDRLEPAGTFTWQSPLSGGGTLPLARESAYGSALLLSLDELGSRWQNIGGGGGGPRADHSAVYDPGADAMIVFGGRSAEDADSRSDGLSRLVLADGRWETLDLADGPGPRFAHSAVYDSRNTRMLVYGGTTDWANSLDELWSLDLSAGWESASWQKLQPAGDAPAARFDHAAVYHERLGWMLVLGGTRDGLGQLNDLVALDLSAATPTWLALETDGPLPQTAQGLAAAYEPGTDRAVFQGGRGEGAVEGLTWSLRCRAAGAPTWTPSPAATQASSTPGPSLTDIHLPRLERP